MHLASRATTKYTHIQEQEVRLDPSIQAHDAHDIIEYPSEQTREPTPESDGFSDTQTITATELPYPYSRYMGRELPPDLKMTTPENFGQLHCQRSYNPHIHYVLHIWALPSRSHVRDKANALNSLCEKDDLRHYGQTQVFIARACRLWSHYWTTL